MQTPHYPAVYQSITLYQIWIKYETSFLLILRANTSDGQYDAIICPAWRRAHI